MGCKGHKPSHRKMTALSYINTTNPKSSIIREKLIEDGIKESKCEICGVEGIWMGKRLPLELHHKDGNHFNNTLENLQILCPNCHAIQEGNCGANKGKYNLIKEKKKMGELYIIGILGKLE